MELRSACFLFALFTVLLLIPVMANAPVLADFGGGFTDPFTSVSSGCTDDFGNYIC
jgi:hypothetical protein